MDPTRTGQSPIQFAAPHLNSYIFSSSGERSSPKADLSALLSASPPLGVSIYLPTHILGAEVCQGPIRLKNLAGQARQELVTAGLPPAQVDAFMNPRSG